MGMSRPHYLSAEKPACELRSNSSNQTWNNGLVPNAYLAYMQSTSCEMPGWMKHKLESRFPGEISITLDKQMTLPLWQKAKKN